MSESEQTTRANRILVVVDTSPDGLEALEVAAALAAASQAELHGLFIEDEELLRLAGLPFAREVGYTSAVRRQLDPLAIQRALRLKAEQVRRALADTAQRMHVEWSFQIARGRVISYSLAAASQADVLLLGRESRAGRPRPVPHAPQRPLLVVYDGSPSGDRTLDVAAQLAREDKNSVVVFLAIDQDQDVSRLRRNALERLSQLAVEATVHSGVVHDAQGLIAMLRRQRGKILLMNREHHLLDEQAIEALINYLDYPVGLLC